MKKEINWNKYSFTETELKESVKQSISLRATLIKLGLKGEGGGINQLKELLD